MQWFMDNFSLILTCALILSEAAAAVVQMAFPTNKGVSGILAGVIKFLQSMGAKDSLTPKS